MAVQAGSLSAEMETLNHVFRLVEAFRAFDADNDGSIDKQELSGIMGSLGYDMSEQDVEAMMQKGDADKDGQLSMSEFLDMNTEGLGLGGGLSISLKRALEVMDFERDEAVTEEELYEVFDNMGVGISMDECEEIIACMDGDGDGAANYEDLKLIVGSLV